jgi:hypothetical protein
MAAPLDPNATDQDPRLRIQRAIQNQQQAQGQTQDPNYAPPAQAGSSFQWNKDNIFQYGDDLNPLAQQVGGGADGVRDSLAESRDAFIRPYMQTYRGQVGTGSGRAAEDDATLSRDPRFRSYVQTGNLDPSLAQAAQVSPGPAANGFLDASRGYLLDFLKGNSTPATANDPTIAPAAEAYRNEQTRAQRMRQNEMAEYLGAKGLESSGGMASDIAASFEDMGRNTAGYTANLVKDENDKRRSSLLQGLSIAMQSGDSEQARAIQLALAKMDDDTRRYSVDTSAGLTRDQMGIDMGQFEASLNRQYLLDLLGGR